MTAGILNRFGVVSDEIHSDPATAFAIARELGMEAVDLNSLWGKPITDLTTAEVRRVKELAAEQGVRPFLIAGSSFKSMIVEGMTPANLLASPEFGEHMATLERSLAVAQTLGAPCARVFSFRWPHMQGLGNPSPRYPGGGEIPQQALEVIAACLRAACELGDRYGVLLGIENVRSCYGNSGRNTRAIMDAVAHERLRVIWDPANAYVSGEEQPYPDGYQAVRPYVVHLHVKDAVVVDTDTGLTAWECIGQGAVDYLGQLRALAAEGYGGILCLETHWSPAGRSPEEASRLSLQGLLEARKRALGAA